MNEALREHLLFFCLCEQIYKKVISYNLYLRCVCSLPVVVVMHPVFMWTAGFLCASKLRLHQRCKFVRQWLAKNHDSERTGAALLSVRTHHYLTHSGGPGDWWVPHVSSLPPLIFLFLFFFLVSLLLFSHPSPKDSNKMHRQAWECIKGDLRSPKM